MVNLGHKCILRLSVRKPFNFRTTLWKPSHFPTGLECHEPEVTWRTFRFGPRMCGVRAEMDDGRLLVQAFSNRPWDRAAQSRLEQRLINGYGLVEDIKPFGRMAVRNIAVKSAVRRLRGMRMSCPESLFEISIISLLLQNTTIKRSQQMLANILRHYGRTVAFDGRKLTAFCSPQDLSRATEHDLRSICRLGYRAKFLPRFAEFFAHVDDDELRLRERSDVEAALRTIKGVGPYTANVILSHAMRDTGAIPLDVWNRKIMAKALLSRDDASPVAIETFCRTHFPGYGGLVCLYLTEAEYLERPLVPLLLDPNRKERPDK